MEPETFKHAICCFLFVCLFVFLPLFVFIVVFLCVNACMDVGYKLVIKIWVPWPFRYSRTSLKIPKQLSSFLFVSYLARGIALYPLKKKAVNFSIQNKILARSSLYSFDLPFFESLL